MIPTKDIIILWLSKIVFKYATNTVKNAFRRLENTQRKLVSVEEHQKFNKQCIQHDLLPIYTNIKLHDATAGSHEFVKKFRKELIVRQINKQQADITSLSGQINECEENLQQLTKSDLRFQAFKVFLARIINNHRLNLQL